MSILQQERLEEKIIKLAYSPQSSLVIKDRKSFFSTVFNAFIGSEFIDWIIKMKFKDTKEEALLLGNKMLAENDIKSPNNDKNIILTNYYQFRNLSIVIIGGGGSGLVAATQLQKNLYYDVTVITKEKDYYYIPSIPFSFSGEKMWKKDFESILTQSKIIYAEASIIESKSVTLKDGRKVDDFDYLIISSGSYYEDIPVKDNKTIVIKANIPEDVEKNLEEIKKSKEIVVVGSGTVGCEYFGPLCEFNPEKTITMISSSKTVISRRPEDLQTPILNHFKSFKNGKLKFGQRVTEISEGKVKTDQEEIKADVVFLATGFKPNTKLFEKFMSSELDSNGYVKVNEFCQMVNYPHIFIGGDIVNIKEEKLGQAATEHANDIVFNIKSILERAPLKKYVPGPRGYATYLGSQGSLAMGDKQMWFGKMVSTFKYYGYSQIYSGLVNQ